MAAAAANVAMKGDGGDRCCRFSPTQPLMRKGGCSGSFAATLALTTRPAVTQLDTWKAAGSTTSSHSRLGYGLSPASSSVAAAAAVEVRCAAR